MEVRYSASAWRLFDFAFFPRRKMGWRETRVAGLPAAVPARQPLLIVANHVSWWDGFILRSIQQRIRPGGRLLIVMLKKELDRRPFLKRLGGIGLEPGSATSLRALLRGLRELRSREPDFSVLFFPQGRIWPSFRRPLGFQGGIRLLVEALAPVAVLPLGVHLEGGNRMAPAAYVSSAPLQPGLETASEKALEASVETELDTIHHFLAQHGEDAEIHWPPKGEALPKASGSLFKRI